MRKTYIVALAVVAALLTVIAVQSNKLERRKSEYVALELKFNQYKLDQAQSNINIARDVREQNKQDLKVKDEEIRIIKGQLLGLIAADTNTQRMLKQAEQRLRQAKHTADNGSCEDAREAIGVCADLYSKLDRRVKQVEPRVGIVSQYADELDIELKACIRAYANVEEALH